MKQRREIFWGPAAELFVKTGLRSDFGEECDNRGSREHVVQHRQKVDCNSGIYMKGTIETYARGTSEAIG